MQGNYYYPTMIYLVHTLKELSSQTINTDFVLEAADENEIKLFVSSHKLIVLWITPVKWWPNSWQFFGVFKDTDWKNYKFCLKAESLEAACNRCIELELPLISINDTQNPMTEEESKEYINNLVQKKQEQENKAKQELAIEKKEYDKIIDDKRKEKIMQVIGETLIELTEIENSQINNIKILWEKRKLHDLKEQLTKIKMWSNLEKATSVLEETFALMEKVEMTILSDMKEQETQVINSSVISNVDIITELEKIKRSNQTSQAGTKKNSSDLYYTYLWIVGLYQKFIIKDIFSKFSQLKGVVTSSIAYIEFGLLSCNVLIGLYLFSLLMNNNINHNILISMITLWIAWIVRKLPITVRKSSFMMNIIYIILAIIIIIIIQRMIIINFALI